MFLRKYGSATHIYIPVIKRAAVDFAVSADWTPAAGDVKISKDGGAAANVTNLPTAITMGNAAMWDFSLTATEMQAAQVMVTVADAATKAVEDQMFVIETYGNASAQHAVDLSDSVRAGLTALPNAAAGANGGLPTGDANAAVKVQAGTGTGQIDFTSGVVKANVTQFGGSAGTFASGRPEVNTSHIAGAAVSTSTAQIGVNVVNFGGAAGTFSSGRPEVNATHWAGTIVATPDTAGHPKVTIKNGTGTGEVSLSSGLVNITQTAADKVWSTTSRVLTAGTNIQLPANGLANVTAWTVNITGNLSGSVGSVTGAVGSVTGNVGGNVTGSVGSVTGAVGSVTGNVGGNVVGSVGSVTGLTAANLDVAVSTRLAAASYTAPDNTTITAIAGYIDTEVADIVTKIGTPAGASLAADIAAVKSESGAIKTKTDSLTFSVPGYADVNIQYVNDVQVSGTGAVGDEWGP